MSRAAGRACEELVGTSSFASWRRMDSMLPPRRVMTAISSHGTSWRRCSSRR
ncbi:hypothetical protein ACFPRL_29645 [Pseudoclavibacter helvolus]